MSNYSNQSRNNPIAGRAIDAFTSRRLLNWTDAYKSDKDILSLPESSAPNTPYALTQSTGIMFSENSIHAKPLELFQFYNDMLNQFGQDALSPQEKMITAQAGLEALTIQPTENYKDWYEYIGYLLDDAIGDAFDSGNLAQAARWQAHLITLPLHKYIAQVKNFKPVTLNAHKNSETLLEISEYINTYLRESRGTISENEQKNIIGISSELTVLSALGTGRLFNHGMIAFPSYEWEDSSLTNPYSGASETLNGFDIRLFNYKNEEETKLQIKSSSNYPKEYEPGIAVIKCDEIVQDYRDKTGFNIGNIWKLSTMEIDEARKKEILNYICDHIIRKKEALKPLVDPRFKDLSKINFN